MLWLLGALYRINDDPYASLYYPYLRLLNTDVRYQVTVPCRSTMVGRATIVEW
jgi:hypothetical protein